jgi:hypothetical protein
MFAAEIRKRRLAQRQGFIQWNWHLDEVFGHCHVLRACCVFGGRVGTCG